MHAVVRETTYDPDQPIQDRREFHEFQAAHAGQPGYRGTIVVDAGDGRYLTVTLWETADDMDAGRKAMTPVVERLINPLLRAPAKLVGTGPVVVDDITRSSSSTESRG